MHAPSDLGLVLFTLWTALVATALILPLGVLAGWLLARWDGRAKPLLETLLTLPLVLPPTAVGLLLLLLLERGSLMGRLFEAMGLDVLFSWRAVVIASSVMALPLLVRSVRDAVAGTDRRLFGMARSLGQTPIQALWRVELPQARRGIIGGALLAFARALGEFGATVLVAGNIPGRTQTLALAIFQRVQRGQPERANGLLLLTVLVAFSAVFAAGFLERRRARSGLPA